MIRMCRWKTSVARRVWVSSILAALLLAAGLGPASLIPPVVAQSTDVSLIPVASGFNQPVAAVEPPDESGRLFVVERPGTIRILSGGQKLATPFLDVTSLVVSGFDEQGLLGLAFHPDF